MKFSTTGISGSSNPYGGGSSISSSSSDYDPYIQVWENPYGDDAQTMNIREAPSGAQYLPNTQGQMEDQQAWQSGENAADRGLQFALGMAPIDWSREKYGRTTGTGLYQSLVGGPNSALGGANTAQTPITTGPIWSGQQVNQQVNQAVANNQASAATQNREIANRAAGQGFASRSPLIAALQNQTNAATMATNAKSEQDIRWNAAEGNAQHVLDTEKAREDQWANWNDADIRRLQTANQGQASLLAALGAFL